MQWPYFVWEPKCQIRPFCKAKLGQDMPHWPPPFDARAMTPPKPENPGPKPGVSNTNTYNALVHTISHPGTLAKTIWYKRVVKAGRDQQDMPHWPPPFDARAMKAINLFFSCIFSAEVFLPLPNYPLVDPRFLYGNGSLNVRLRRFVKPNASPASSPLRSSSHLRF
jgi:hypothetical protein